MYFFCPCDISKLRLVRYACKAKYLEIEENRRNLSEKKNINNMGLSHP